MLRMGVHEANVGIFTPFPGTPAYLEAKKRGTLIGDWSIDEPTPWVKLDWTDSSADLHDCLRRVRRRIMIRPKAILAVLMDGIRSMNLRKVKFGFRFVGHILKKQRYG
jgi:hypothetical protein